MQSRNALVMLPLSGLHTEVSSSIGRVHKSWNNLISCGSSVVLVTPGSAGVPLALSLIGLLRMNDLSSKHIEIIRRSKWQRNIYLLCVALISIVYGAILSITDQRSGDWSNTWVVIAFGIVFPLGLFRVISVSFGEHFTALKKIIESNEPVRAVIEDFDPIPGSIRLGLPNGHQFFRLVDLATNLINALKCEFAVSKHAQQEKRRQIVQTFNGKDGTYYGGLDSEYGILFVDDSALTLRQVSSQKAEELEKLQREFRNK